MERWVEGGRLDPFGRERDDFLRHLGRYLGFRAVNFPASPEEGASLSALGEMARVNAAALADEKTAQAVEAALTGLGELDLHPVHVDARLHVWEWVRPANGGFCKADALDHSCDHSLIGCQDIAWDVAGAAIEFRLSPGEVEDLRGAVGRTCGRAVEPQAVRMLGLCYAAFQGGVWRMAEEAASPAESPRVRRQGARYADVLRAASGGRR